MLGICKITGAALREFRKEQGLTIQEFADSVGYKFRAMANIETGSSPIPLKLHIQIEKVYGVEFLHILNRIDFTGLTKLQKRCRKQLNCLCMRNIYFQMMKSKS